MDAFAKGIEKLSDFKTRNAMFSECKEIVKQFDLKVSIEQRNKIYYQILNI